MEEEELRALVREAVERHLGHSAGTARGTAEQWGQNPAPREGLRPHSSHLILKVVPGSAIDEGVCVIEPAVRCNHCGFCQSLGH